MGSACGTHDLRLTAAEPIASGRTRQISSPRSLALGPGTDFRTPTVGPAVCEESRGDPAGCRGSMSSMTARPATAATSATVPDGVWAPARRRLTTGLVLTITLVAFEALAIATIMP